MGESKIFINISRSITVFYATDGGKPPTEKNIGWFKIPGVKIGEKMEDLSIKSE